MAVLCHLRVKNMVQAGDPQVAEPAAEKVGQAAAAVQPYLVLEDFLEHIPA
jgi:hypothetical protein